MADPSHRMPANVAGPWFVDDTCIACGACVSLAPDTFDLQPDGLAFVKAQPSGEAQLAACQEALESCPVEAIGTEG